MGIKNVEEGPSNTCRSSDRTVAITQPRLEYLNTHEIHEIDELILLS